MKAENEYSKSLPKKLGRPKKIESPDILWGLAVSYFENTDNTPWIRNELIKSGDLAGVIIGVPTTVPYTWSGLEVFCMKLGYNTRLDEYKANRNGGFEDYHDTVKAIASIMYSQKFAGASVGAFNASIISSDLGLADKTIIETRDITDAFDYDDLDDNALEQIAAARIKAKNNG